MATYLPSILREFRERYPFVKVKMRPLHAIDLIAAVRSRKIQLGFVHAPVDDAA